MGVFEVLRSPWKFEVSIDDLGRVFDILMVHRESYRVFDVITFNKSSWMVVDIFNGQHWALKVLMARKCLGSINGLQGHWKF